MAERRCVRLPRKGAKEIGVIPTDTREREDGNKTRKIYTYNELHHSLKRPVGLAAGDRRARPGSERRRITTQSGQLVEILPQPSDDMCSRSQLIRHMRGGAWLHGPGGDRQRYGHREDLDAPLRFRAPQSSPGKSLAIVCPRAARIRSHRPFSNP